MKDTTSATVEGIPIPLSEIADHRQVQSDMSPRLGLITEPHSMKKTGQEERVYYHKHKGCIFAYGFDCRSAIPRSPILCQQIQENQIR